MIDARRATSRATSMPDLPEPRDLISQALERFRALAAARPRTRIERDQRAAVLVPVIEDGGPVRLLLTRRAQELPTHQGQVAFPGGFLLDPAEDPVHASLREAEEEIGLPAVSVEILGLLDDALTHTGLVSVTPVVGRIAKLPALKAAPSEVARIFTIPAADLLESGRWRRRGPTVEFEHDGEVLWGLSARIVLRLLDLSGLGRPIEPPG